MIITLGARRADTDTRELTLRYRGRRRPDVSVCQLLQQRLGETDSITPTALA
jgi:hypothetical protein